MLLRQKTVALNNFPYPGYMDGSKYKVPLSDSPCNPRSQSLPRAEACLKAPNYLLRNTGSSVDFMLNEKIQSGHKMSIQKGKKFY